MEIFGYKERDNLIGKNISEYYADLAELQAFSEKVKQDGFAHDILRLKDANDKIMELECFTEHINEFKKARWGILIDVTKRERYYRALDRMPTGYYRIRYDKKEADKHVGRIEHCNDQFARILGVEDKETLIGQDVRSFYASVDEGKEYLRFLEMLDKGGAPVQGHPLRIKRADNGQIVHISIDSQLVRENGEVIGREGTIRDITEKVELEKKVKETESRLKKTTADINNLIHTFLHPVLKFYGHSELLDTLGRILYKSARHRVPAKADLKKLAKQLEDRLLEIQNRLDTISETGSDSAAALARTFEKIINGFDYSVDKAENSNILLDKVIRDTALWVLEELDLAGYFNENLERGTLPDVFDGEFIQFLENILFEYIIRTAGILKGETQVMRREAEALRKYIGLGEKRRHTPRRQNLGKIIEENIELFKPLFLQKDIEIEYRPSGNLYASISENDIDRVVCNLLYNAKKYSYEGPGCVVRVRTRNLHRENAVELIISNLGTPIKRDEIESGKIFKFGYRSKLVYRTDRDGTGVGLADAWDVIHEHHGGTITITSEPAGSRDDGDPPRYRVPYITTVTVRLPVHRG
ncbi:MAG: PAS domain-containing sensor histidine kinase [bacterium]|nr:PAS domain-containing sensor histidine kinase [bacterium]